jgi:hypothetical protein
MALSIRFRHGELLLQGEDLVFHEFKGKYDATLFKKSAIIPYLV